MKRKMFTRGVSLFLACSFVALTPFTTFASGSGATNFTYTYDFWGLPTPSPDAYRVTDFILGYQFGIGHFRNPQGLFIRENRIYVADSGNNRIVVFSSEGNGEYELIRVVYYVTINGVQSNFNSPRDVFEAENGHIFIADTLNNRVLHLDDNWNFVNEVLQPESETMEQGTNFQPSNLIVDSGGRIFVQAMHVNRGLMEFDPTGEFVGYLGANRVQISPIDYFWRMIATAEQRARMELFIPTEFSNVAIDNDGFIFVTSANDQGYAVRRLNAMGSDIMIRNGHTDPIGDLWTGSAAGISGPSRFIDVVALPNDTFVAFDSTRGRLFAYDFQGNLLYVFGGVGNREGSFLQPIALANMEYSLFALDHNTGAITRFDLTEYGALINLALEQYRVGQYEESAATWQEVLRINGNFEMAYIGIARSYLRQGYYREAMEFFRIQNDREGFGRAFQFYRREWMDENFWIFMVTIGAIIIVPPTVRTVLKVRKEINEA